MKSFFPFYVTRLLVTATSGSLKQFVLRCQINFAKIAPCDTEQKKKQCSIKLGLGCILGESKEFSSQIR